MFRLFDRFFGPELPSHLVEDFHALHLPTVRKAFIVLVPVGVVAMIALHDLNPATHATPGEHLREPTFQALLGALTLAWFWMVLAKPIRTFSLACITLMAVAYGMMIHLSELNPDFVKWQTPQFMIWQLGLSPLALRVGTFATTILLTVAAPVVAMAIVGVDTAAWITLSAYLLALSALSTIVFRTCNRMRREAFLARLSLQHEAFRDGLTGALNRKRFFQLAQPLMQGITEKQLPISVCFMDLDNFKRVNDQEGHIAGDVVLSSFAQVAKAVSARLRGEHKPLFARLGGEEFVLLLPGCTGEQAAGIAQSICDETRVARPGNRALTVSIGVAEALPDESCGSLVHRADLAMLRAKSAGKDRVAFASEVQPEGGPALATSTR